MAERAQAVGAKTFVADLTRLEEALALARFVEEEAPSTGWSTPWAASPPGGFGHRPGALRLDAGPEPPHHLQPPQGRPALHGQAGEGFFAAFAAGPAWTGAGPGRALYTAAKTALASLLRSLQGEVEGVRFLVVYPMGTLDTEANRKAMPEADFSRWIAPELVAKVVVEAAGAKGGRLLELPIYPPL